MSANAIISFSIRAHRWFSLQPSELLSIEGALILSNIILSYEISEKMRWRLIENFIISKQKALLKERPISKEWKIEYYKIPFHFFFVCSFQFYFWKIPSTKNIISPFLEFIVSVAPSGSFI